MSTPYRTPGKPHTEHARKRWAVRWSQPGAEITIPEGSLMVLFVCSAIIGVAFVFYGASPAVQRAVLVWAIFAAAWCAAFVRREWA